MPTTGMTRAFGGIVSDPRIDVRVRRAIDRLTQPFLLVTNEAPYLDDQGRIALRLASDSLSQSVAGLSIAQDIRTTASPTFAGLTLAALTITGFTGFLYAANGVVSPVTNLCTLINANVTQTGNTAATETTLFTYTVPGGTLAATGDCLEFMASGSFSGTGNTDKRIRLKFGATTVLDTVGNSGGAAFDWSLRGTIIRTGSATQKCECALQWAANGGIDLPQQTQNYITAAETLSGDVVLKLTGQGASANDVVGEFWKVVKQST